MPMLVVCKYRPRVRGNRRVLASVLRFLFGLLNSRQPHLRVVICGVCCQFSSVKGCILSTGGICGKRNSAFGKEEIKTRLMRANAWSHPDFDRRTEATWRR
ncbi:hypothetical protein F4818DRAFT_407796 [Hypoxylon cercidicola]|nr:hypothetical protein F4818DRAFT_407796 [Hypoxylon cercidicola]